jgi:7,8-dihydropterin-6-yl-methyl-4-(beta-D-ribofuranosyl)aminobenzene 5'-phosphate synthase
VKRKGEKAKKNKERLKTIYKPMKITVLTENMAGGKFLAEHGLSYLIEHDNQKILFDTGHSDVFLQNARNMNLDIVSGVETIVLSHGHWDHGNGLQYLENKKLIAHPGAFIKRYRKGGNKNIGLKFTREELDKKFQIQTSRKPLDITGKMIFLGEIPRLVDFEPRPTLFVDENGKPDQVLDDSALAIVHRDALFIITGCSHAGICNILEHAKKVTGIKNIKAVLGGFHLSDGNQQTIKTIEYFREAGVKHVNPSHCTAFSALVKFHEAFGSDQVKTGMKLNF